MKHVFRVAVSALLVTSALSGAARAQEVSAIPVTTTEAPAPAGPVQRYFLLLFDSPLGGMRQMDELSVAVEEWMSHELSPTDAAAVVSYYGQELLVAQDFTRDRQALSEAVGAAIRGQAHASTPAEEEYPSLLARLPQGEELERRAASFYGALQVLAGSVDSVPGSKSLLLFSKGFGRPAASPVLEKYLPEHSLYEPTREALLSRQIRLYPVDLATDYRETFPLAGVMSRLAAETGGRYVYPVTELPHVLEQIAQANAPVGDALVERQALTPGPSPASGRGVQSE